VMQVKIINVFKNFKLAQYKYHNEGDEIQIGRPIAQQKYL